MTIRMNNLQLQAIWWLLQNKKQTTNQISERNLRQKRIYCIILFVPSNNKQTNKNTGKSNLCSLESGEWLFMQVGSGCKELNGGGGFWNEDKVQLLNVGDDYEN